MNFNISYDDKGQQRAIFPTAYSHSSTTTSSDRAPHKTHVKQRSVASNAHAKSARKEAEAPLITPQPPRKQEPLKQRKDSFFRRHSSLISPDALRRFQAREFFKRHVKLWGGLLLATILIITVAWKSVGPADISPVDWVLGTFDDPVFADFPAMAATSKLAKAFGSRKKAAARRSRNKAAAKADYWYYVEDEGSLDFDNDDDDIDDGEETLMEYVDGEEVEFLQDKEHKLNEEHEDADRDEALLAKEPQPGEGTRLKGPGKQRQVGPGRRLKEI